MNVSGRERKRRLSAISGIFASLIMFAMIFSVALGYFVLVTQSGLKGQQANQVQQQAFQGVILERLSVNVGLSSVADPWGKTGDLWLRIANTGSSSVTLIDVFVTNSVLDRIVSTSQVAPGTQYLASKSLAAGGDLNLSLPLTISPGVSTAMMTGCGTAQGCDIGISKNSYTFGGTPVVVSVLTTRGNVFSGHYPPPPTNVVTSTTSTVLTASTNTIALANQGGNILVVQMVATPQQTFSCANCVNDTITVYNYGTSQVTGVALSPSVPLISITGTAIVKSTGPCTLILGSTTIPAYSGSGAPPKIVFRCKYSANPNGAGGFASFTGGATGMYNLSPVTSGISISNTIQIGGPLAVLNQGPFSANFFLFKYSACTSGAHPCPTNPSPVTYANLPTASLIPGSDQYVAFYVQISNNFNVSIPILPYSFFLTDPTQGGESPFFLVGNPSSLPYIPNYASSTPSLTAYPSTCIASSTSTCINVPANGNAVLTFAACDIGSTYWDWAGSSYGSNFDPGNNCTTNPPGYVHNESTYLSIMITFVYKGQVYTEQIPFVGQTVS